METSSFRNVLKGQLKAARLFQEYDMDFRTWEVLLIVAMDEGDGLVSLAKKHGVSKSSFSRNVLFLCGERSKRGNQKDMPEVNATNNPGVLVERRKDPNDIRRQNLYLTNEGKAFIVKIQKFLSEE